ncbi:Sodium/potassium/calcium exchanger Nckx30C [Rhynchospora pubera]|uniref:Sodium/potassium/calcium exchanger Nckx30C n=1 Tax=Rhynchospora pubera TaxID=906938 RepID=A0AAV8I093_9POAL|nr:Sodium/potassium/calcium exchanger Nckx30C [Rhynchospora pubera]
MLPFFFLFLFFLLGPTPSSAHHSIAIISSNPLRLSSLAWNPISKHFLVGSSEGPTIYAVSDSGMVQCLLSDISLNSTGASVAGVAVDHVRHRLIAAFSNSSVAAYDLTSYSKICSLPLPQLDGAPGGVAVDMENGEVFITSSRRGIVLKVRLDGDGSIISEYEINDDQGLGGIVHVVNDQNPYILVIQTATGEIFKIESNDGIVKEVSSDDKSNTLALSGSAIALHNDLSLTVAANRNLLLLQSDGTWSRASVKGNIRVKHHDQSIAVVTQQGKKAYALIESPHGYRIEEVQWWKFPLLRCLLFILLGGCLIGWTAVLRKMYIDHKGCVWIGVGRREEGKKYWEVCNFVKSLDCL